jgi:hypothetical protein
MRHFTFLSLLPRAFPLLGLGALGLLLLGEALAPPLAQIVHALGLLLVAPPLLLGFLLPLVEKVVATGRR